MHYPDLLKVRQQFDQQRTEDIPGTVSAELAKLNLASRCRPGQTVALTAGSRGISNIAEIYRSVVAELKALGLKPFIVPAMGSHGGGTAEGQAKVLKKYGITEESTGAPIRASMDIVQLGKTKDGVAVVLDRIASQADWIGVINRVKPHTKFTGDIESGLCKMILIGLGKAEGATIYHRASVTLSFDHVVNTAVPIFLEKAKLLFGLGIVENGYDQTARLTATGPEELIEREKELLRDAKRRMPKLPFDQFDVVVVDRIGKNFSGTGIDTNIVGSKSGISITRIYARDLTPESEGNAAGVGYVHLIHRRIADKMDARSTYLNCLTANSLEAARIAMTYDSDREALEVALRTIGLTEPEDARLCWIPNTLHLDTVWLSKALKREVESRSDLRIEEGPRPITFDARGDFQAFPNMFPNGQH